MQELFRKISKSSFRRAGDVFLLPVIFKYKCRILKIIIDKLKKILISSITNTIKQSVILCETECSDCDCVSFEIIDVERRYTLKNLIIILRI